MSRSELMGTKISSVTRALPLQELGSPAQMGQPLFQVKSCCDSFESQTKLHHRECNFRLDSDDHGFCAAEAAHQRDFAQSTRSKGIQNIQGSNVNDNP